jgi:uncharacterized membrane-anchored protein
MENRKNLHDYGLIMIFFGILELFMFIMTVVAGLVDGSIAKALADVAPEIQTAVKVGLGIMGAITGLLVFADALLGVKALKVSANPNTDNGYIIVAKVFFVLSVIATISAVVGLFDGNAPIIDTILDLVSSVLGALVYILFVRAAQAVRQDALNAAK